MSNLYSKIATKPMKRTQENNMSVSVSQTNAWMNNGKDILVSIKNLCSIYSGRCRYIEKNHDHCAESLAKNNNIKSNVSSLFIFYYPETLPFIPLLLILTHSPQYAHTLYHDSIHESPTRRYLKQKINS